MKKRLLTFIVFVIIILLVSPMISKEITESAGKDPSESLLTENSKSNNVKDELEEETVEDETTDETTEDYVEEDLLAGTTYTVDGKTMVKNTDDILVLVNKNRNLPADYKPNDLVIPNVRFSFEENIEKKYMRKEAAQALEELFNEAEKSGIYLYAVSGFRSYERQKYLFDYRAARDGFEEANKLTAYPGQSEHQTGLAMDISCESLGFDLRQEFEQTAEGKWLKENAHKYGFIIRYPKGAEDITGYSYEPWHVRYVGKETADKIYERGITLEEYLGDKSSIPVLNK